MEKDIVKEGKEDLKGRVSIVIPAFNAAATIRRCIESCLLQDYPSGLLDIIVVDDGSRDDTRDIVKDLPVRYLYQDRRGPAAARNLGWRNTQSPFICFTDADCIPERHWVSKLVRAAISKGVAAVGGSYDIEGCRYLLDRFVHAEVRFRHFLMPEFMNSFGTYNVLVRRNVLEAISGFDEAYKEASGEDTDLSCRIIKAGHRIYFERDALVGHANLLHLSKYLRIQFKHGYWRMRIYRKNGLFRDDYATRKDLMEIIAISGLAASSLAPLNNNISWALYFLALLAALNLYHTVIISIREKDWRYVVCFPALFLRAFVRFSGGVAGLVRFWIFKDRQ